MSKYEELEKLAKLKESGAITENEFLKEKDKILGGEEKDIIQKVVLNRNIENSIDTSNTKEIKLSFKEYNFEISVSEEYFRQVYFNNKSSEFIKSYIDAFNQLYFDYNNLDKVITEINSVASILIKDFCGLIAEVLFSMEIFDHNKDSLLTLISKYGCYIPYNEAFKFLQQKYDEILIEKQQKEAYRELRKDFRKKYDGYEFEGDAFDRNVKSIGANILTGIGHSIVNSIGNSISEAEANKKKETLYNDPAFRDILFDGFKETFYMIVKKISNHIFNKTTQEKMIDDKKSAQILFDNIEKAKLSKERYLPQLSKCINLDISNKLFFEKLLNFFKDEEEKVEEIFNFTFNIRGIITGAYIKIEKRYLKYRVKAVLNEIKNNNNSKASQLISDILSIGYITTSFEEIVFSELNSFLKTSENIKIEEVFRVVNSCLKLFNIDYIDYNLLPDYKILKSKIKDIVTKNSPNDAILLTDLKGNHKTIIEIMEEEFSKTNDFNFLERSFNLFKINYTELITEKEKSIYNFFVGSIQNILNKNISTKPSLNGNFGKLKLIKDLFNPIYYIKERLKGFNKEKIADKNIYESIIEECLILEITQKEMDDLSEYKEFKKNFEFNLKDKEEELEKIVDEYKNSLNCIFKNGSFKLSVKKWIIILIVLSFFVGLFPLPVIIINFKIMGLLILTLILTLFTTTIMNIIAKIRFSESKKSKIYIDGILKGENILSFIDSYINTITLDEKSFQEKKEIYQEKIKKIEEIKNELERKNKSKSKFNKIAIAFVILEVMGVVFLQFIKPILDRAEYLRSVNETLRKECDLKNADSCNSLGFNYEFGEGIDKNINKANELYKKACDLDYAKGCNNLGLNYLKGIGVVKDIEMAKEFFKKGCSLEYELACNNSCNLGDNLICTKLGYNYEKGFGVVKNLNKANEFYKKACDLGDGSGCSNLGINYADGTGVEKGL